MLTALRKRHLKDEDGFTLIELMVVVLIIAILIAIAIPTFLGAQNRARDRGAQSDLRNAIQAAKTIATDNAGVFVTSGTTGISATAMAAAEPSLSFIATDPTTAGPIGVLTENSNGNITLWNKSASGQFFCISASATGAVTYGKGTTADAVNTAAECDQPKW